MFIPKWNFYSASSLKVLDVVPSSSQTFITSTFKIDETVVGASIFIYWLMLHTSLFDLRYSGLLLLKWPPQIYTDTTDYLKVCQIRYLAMTFFATPLLILHYPLGLEEFPLFNQTTWPNGSHLERAMNPLSTWSMRVYYLFDFISYQKTLPMDSHPTHNTYGRKTVVLPPSILHQNT